LKRIPDFRSPDKDSIIWVSVPVKRGQIFDLQCDWKGSTCWHYCGTFLEYTFVHNFFRCRIPYVAVVLPLIAVSVYLLLSKPRTAINRQEHDSRLAVEDRQGLEGSQEQADLRSVAGVLDKSRDRGIYWNHSSGG
jgi:hypothetical protein